MYAADQISKKDESIKSLLGYIHRLEQQTLLLRKASNKRHARAARRCHSQETEAVRNLIAGNDSAGSSDCSPPEGRMSSAGARGQCRASCPRTHQRSVQRSSERTVQHDVCPQQQHHRGSHAQSTLRRSSWADNMPVASTSGVLHAADPRSGAESAPDPDFLRQLSGSQTSRYDRNKDSPITDSYASQLWYARESTLQTSSGDAADRNQRDSSGLAPVAELSVEAWPSASAVSAAGTGSEPCEQPSLDMFGGTFGTRPDFTVGEHFSS